MNQPRHTNAQSKPTDSKPKNPCNGCGNTHWKKECPFKNAECHLCKKKGHIKKMCFKAQSQKSQSKSNVNFSSLHRFLILRLTHAMSLSMLLMVKRLILY